MPHQKRKHNKKYEYSENTGINRTSHTYINYLSYINKHYRIYVCQYDFLGTVKTDNNDILSFILLDLPFILLDLIKSHHQSKVVTFFYELEEKNGTNAFIELIPNVENINKPLRLFFKKTIDTYNKQDIKNINQTFYWQRNQHKLQ